MNNFALISCINNVTFRMQQKNEKSSWKFLDHRQKSTQMPCIPQPCPWSNLLLNILILCAWTVHTYERLMINRDMRTIIDCTLLLLLLVFFLFLGWSLLLPLSVKIYFSLYLYYYWKRMLTLLLLSSTTIVIFSLYLTSLFSL